MDPAVTVLDHPLVRSCAEHVRTHDERTLEDQVVLTETPAPPFGEQQRGDLMARLMADAGLERIQRDDVGNVLALRRGRPDLEPVVVAAHLDTVFPAETPVSVHRDGPLLAGPGISDNGRGMAVMLAVARALAATGLRTAHPILFAATVGEEGLGDLRGARHLVGPSGAAARAAAFIAVDGAGIDHIVTRGLGSRRFRIQVDGPGGHSWMNRGLENPIHALAHAVSDVRMPPPPSGHEQAFTVARWGGGTSINAVPQAAWLEVDCRSSSESHLEVMEAELRRACALAVERENDRGRGGLTLDVARIGVRTAGETPPEAHLVQSAIRATEAVGARPELTLSSTDANAAMARGIPALTLGGGGEADLAHTTREWYRNVDGVEGVIRALYTVALTAGLDA